jgi:hypothetical protein
VNHADSKSQEGFSYGGANSEPVPGFATGLWSSREGGSRFTLNASFTDPDAEHTIPETWEGWRWKS